MVEAIADNFLLGLAIGYVGGYIFIYLRRRLSFKQSYKNFVCSIKGCKPIMIHDSLIIYYRYHSNADCIKSMTVCERCDKCLKVEFKFNEEYR